MSQSPKARGLGRGLSALLGDEDVAAAVAPSPPPAPPQPTPSEAPRPAAAARAPATLPITYLRPGKFQPRTVFEDKDGLVDSVKQFGLLQPILVRPLYGEPDTYEIIAGERRWRAAQKAQLHEVPVVIRTLDDLDALQLALIENLQRTDLSAIDEAMGYRRLMDQFNQTQEQVAETMGRSRPHIANTLRLLDLPEEVRDMVQRHELSAGQARTLLAFPDPVTMAERTVKEKLSVRELERLAAGDKPAAPKAKNGKVSAPVEGTKTADTKALERRLEEALGLKASLSLRGLGEQSILTLEIRDYDQLDLVVERLTRR
ncbi:chromosome partitioning protein, ParB family [Enhydrobacter aerosaccus]|uniref:Chromosome partitioning protein, ParB family n=1 Tax=Enhydrobacter aerosaccus TaxID=225324 RepID=A0A1T4QSF4_9HYPH|nr:ParB/RepB/Spo0J family partition protein [Enhydrobacter aerosaccus]SKA06188.1 chromosome partitioning protein, ParB family [Enhydrobacter aerosaccus]